MTPSPNALLVAPTPRIAATLTAQLIAGGFSVTLVTSFKAARVELQSFPTLVISEVRLGEYNGLHLAVRAGGQGIPAIVVGRVDPVCEREAAALGAGYVAEDCDAGRVGTALRATGIPISGRVARRRARNAA